ncbi:ceramide glucosyltransferase [Microthyrium microscopicum]|uniref:Ceramide glucosyltransferase n=1 Tax=Microthyrium microscopicum TaxID=703497 RepID=A0A6A6UNG8_9PEZI|nr:ceramide glucosyltransferase [Microthyrium microscopicum]
MLSEAVAVVCLSWYCFIVIVCLIGTTQLYRWYSSPPHPSVSSTRGDDAPHVTIIRPVKGLDPGLYDCLACTFHQQYPINKLTIFFCVDSENDPAVPTLRKLLKDYPQFDVQLFIETQDPNLETRGWPMGPNPKIRSMSRAYREAKGDIVWIADCNVWTNKGTCGRMVDTLCGFGGKRPNKFVHQLPLVVDQSPSGTGHGQGSYLWQTLGGRYEEAWFSAAHGKFYTAINTVLVAPCIVGKSNMFRRSHLNALTKDQGIDFFSHNICEDHLIGDLLWKQPIPPSVVKLQDPSASRKPWGNHALDFGDLAVQPVAGMSVSEFFHRRVRWLRVRKFTVLLATLVEPGTESILCSLYGAYAISTMPYFLNEWNIPPTWLTFLLFFTTSVSIWALHDWVLYCHMQAGSSIQMDENTPGFARFQQRRKFLPWLAAWLGRESLAFPIWAWAVYGGVTVAWRGKQFRVGIDMRVTEVKKTR